MINKLSPKIMLGCSACGSKIELNDLNFNDGNFNLSKDSKVTSIIPKIKKSSKVISLF